MERKSEEATIPQLLRNSITQQQQQQLCAESGTHNPQVYKTTYTPNSHEANKEEIYMHFQ